MKKGRIFLLIILYLSVLIFTIAMQWIGMDDPQMRVTTNISTILMASVAGILFFLLYRGGKKQSPDSSENSSLQEQKIPPKERYLLFASAHGLTKRETEIGYLVLHGYSNARLAEELFISETTVKKHLTHIYEKTQTSGRKEFREKILNAG